MNGGSAPQVKAAAQRRLEQAADVLVQRLLGFALDGDAPDADALQAIRDALHRAGVSIEIEVKPYEDMSAGLAGIATRTHAESRSRRGLMSDVSFAATTQAARAIPRLG
jgi:hydroxypyruvate isomerase